MDIFQPLLPSGRPLSDITLREAFKVQPPRMRKLKWAAEWDCNIRLAQCGRALQKRCDLLELVPLTWRLPKESDVEAAKREAPLRALLEERAREQAAANEWRWSDALDFVALPGRPWDWDAPDARPLDVFWPEAETMMRVWQRAHPDASESQAWTRVEYTIGASPFTSIRSCTRKLVKCVAERLPGNATACSIHADGAGPGDAPRVPPPFEPKHEAPSDGGGAGGVPRVPPPFEPKHEAPSDGGGAGGVPRIPPPFEPKHESPSGGASLKINQAPSVGPAPSPPAASASSSSSAGRQDSACMGRGEEEGKVELRREKLERTAEADEGLRARTQRLEEKVEALDSKVEGIDKRGHDDHAALVGLGSKVDALSLDVGKVKGDVNSVAKHLKVTAAMRINGWMDGWMDGWMVG
jgi:hypothetical protein